jgi:hypothetical protein
MPNELSRYLLTRPEGPQQPMSAEEQALRDVLNKPDMEWLRAKDGITLAVPRNPMFAPDPLVIGQPEVARMVRKVLRVAPNVGTRTKRIQMGPTAATAEVLGEAGIPVDRYSDTQLKGTADSRRGDISLNPSLVQKDYDSNRELANTVVHELTHAVGYDDDVAYPVGDLGEALVPPKPYGGVNYDARDDKKHLSLIQALLKRWGRE